MAGPGSRLEKVGTIFSRVQGLLRSGALKDAEKPLWYDVYAKFPPRSTSIATENAPVSAQNILYKEDLVRAKFYKTYGNAGIMDLKDNESPSISQRFVNRFFEIHAANPAEKGKVFEATANALISEGVKLKTFAEIQKERQEYMAMQIAAAAESSSDLNMTQSENAFGQLSPPHEASDTIDERINDPDYKDINSDN